MNKMNAALLCDAYKLGHQQQYPEGTTLVFSNFTPRGNKYAPEAAKSLLMVVEIENELKLVDQVSWDAVRSFENLLRPVFIDGDYMKETTLTEIRERVNKLV